MDRNYGDYNGSLRFNARIIKNYDNDNFLNYTFFPLTVNNVNTILIETNVYGSLTLHQLV